MLFDLAYLIFDLVDIPDNFLSLKNCVVHLSMSLSCWVINDGYGLLCMINGWNNFMYFCYLFPLHATWLFLLFILVTCYTSIPVTYFCYLLRRYSCYWLMFSAWCISTHTHYCSTHHLENASCVPVISFCYTRSHVHLSNHVHTRSTIVQITWGWGDLIIY